MTAKRCVCGAHFENVTLGWPTLDEYVAENGGTYYGALVGRYGNRIGAGKFTLNGKEYTLELNNEPAGIPCALHGGLRGFALRNWTVIEEIHDEDKVGLVMEIKSPDGEGGYPGNVTVRATLIFDNNNVWHIGWKATSDQATPISLTDHAATSPARRSTSAPRTRSATCTTGTTTSSSTAPAMT